MIINVVSFYQTKKHNIYNFRFDTKSMKKRVEPIWYFAFIFVAVLILFLLVLSFILKPKQIQFSPGENITSSGISCTTEEDCMELACPQGGFIHEVCINNTCQRVSSCPNETSCTDSDSGKNYYVKGRTWGMYQGTFINSTDSCLDSLNATADDVLSSNYLGELYCINSSDIGAEKITCSNGCYDGACNQTTCIPSWNCTGFGNCTNNIQFQTCQDLNSCNNLTGMPALNQSCSPPSCIPSWTARNNSCQTEDYYKFWYVDLNNCNSTTGMPANYTLDCDYDKNGIIGNISTIDSNANLKVYINNVSANFSSVYNSEKTLEFREDNLTRVKFEYSFSQPLNLKNITITRQSSSSSFGYLIVTGIEASKTLTINRINSSNKVCAKNSYVEEISDISDACSESGEILISCPGNNSGLACSIISNKFVVSGLTHSAVKEYIYQSPTSCTPYWQCSSWSTCLNNQQARICSDLNSCNILASRPNQTQSCTSVASCTPSWSCTSWLPEKCPKEKQQTRTCSDSNNCNTNIGKPSTTQTCIYKPGTNWLLIIILIVAIVIVAVAIIYLFLKKKQTENNIFLTNRSNPSLSRNY